MSKPNRPIHARVDSEFVGLIMAHYARRLTARNMVVAYATNMGHPPGFGVTGASDLFNLYEDLEFLEDALQTSEKLYELIEFKRLQAQAIIDHVRNEEMGEKQASELIQQVVLIQKEIGRLTEVMEGMAGA